MSRIGAIKDSGEEKYSSIENIAFEDRQINFSFLRNHLNVLERIQNTIVDLNNEIHDAILELEGHDLDSGKDCDITKEPIGVFELINDKTCDIEKNIINIRDMLTRI